MVSYLIVLSQTLNPASRMGMIGRCLVHLMYIAHQKSGKITLHVLGDWLCHVEERVGGVNSTPFSMFPQA